MGHPLMDTVRPSRPWEDFNYKSVAITVLLGGTSIRAFVNPVPKQKRERHLEGGV